MQERKKELFRFLDWQVYRDAQKIFPQILEIVKKLPPELKFSLGDQIIRSSLSIILNIAEGSGRGTDKELNRFFDIAIGSLNETIAALDTLVKCNGIAQNQFEKMFTELASISRQLGGFKKKL